MTGMEQGLRYIEREIRFMVKDQFGNPAYTKYADRVIEDACGIPNFCSTVLSSKRPLAAILRAVRGPRGDIIMRFFNSSLHDTRIEMVMVLAEAVKLRGYHNRNSKNAHDYLMKLYRKANKRLVRLITGSKNKESYKSMYRGLRDFARMDDFDYDDNDDDDEFDDYFDNNSEFGDSDYAEACLAAYRDGKIPPEMESRPYVASSINPTLIGNEEILNEIASIEAKIGRHLTDSELDKLLCGYDDDDDFSYDARNIDDIKKNSDEMIDSIADLIYNKVIDRLEKKTTQPYESLDDFISKNNTESTMLETVHTNNSNAVVDTADIPKSASTEDLIGLHNKLKTSGSDNLSDNQNDDDESSSLPPSNLLGGNYNEAELIEVDVTYSDEEDSNYDNLDDIREDSDIDNCDTNSKEGLVASENNCPPHMQHMLIATDIINDFHLRNADITNQYITRFNNYFDRVGITVNDIFVSVAPSDSEDKLFTLITTIRISGDYEVLNMMHLNTVVLMHVKTIAERFGISEDLIDTKFNVVDSNSLFDNDLRILNTSNKNFTSISIDNLYSALSAIVAYIYNRTNCIVDVRFINDPNSDKIDIYIANKSKEPLNNECVNVFNNELIGERIFDEIMINFYIDAHLDYHLIDKNDTNFFERMKDVIDYHINQIPLVKKYMSANTDFIKDTILSFNNEVLELQSDASISKGKVNLIIDIIYRVYTILEISRAQQNSLECQLEINGEYLVCIEDIFRAISLNTEVNNFITYTVTDIDDEDVEDDNIPKTSNFGI